MLPESDDQDHARQGQDETRPQDRSNDPRLDTQSTNQLSDQIEAYQKRFNCKFLNWWVAGEQAYLVAKGGKGAGLAIVRANLDGDYICSVALGQGCMAQCKHFGLPLTLFGRWQDGDRHLRLTTLEKYRTTSSLLVFPKADFKVFSLS